MKRGNIKGQVTIFIIVAIAIVAVGILIYLFYPNISSLFGIGTDSPTASIQSCLEKDIGNAVETLVLQGGDLNPKHFFMYDNSMVGYLCYTNEYYKPCVMQNPLLKQHIENEIKSVVEEKAKDCFDSMEENYRGKGYEVNLVRGDMNVELLPKRVSVTFDNTLTLKKSSSERYEKFIVVLNNNLYELVSITNSILNFEAVYGDAETTTYMDYYRDLKVEKKKHSDGTTVYIITDRNTENKFQFASRSYAFPPGYGIAEVLG